ncbi:MAG: nicotinate (nicotinamide) nucleotide adenylyltransferase [Bacteroidia bacterium]
MKIGLLFGSFNPVHNGHIEIANFMANHTSLHEVWLVVSPQNPLKSFDSLVEDYHRYKMVEMAIENCPKLKASNIEFNLPKPSYTVDTLEHLRKKYPDYEFIVIMGSDLLQDFNKWKKPELILQHHEIFVYPRKNSAPETFNNHPKIKFIDAPLIEISSTAIRKSISEKRDVGKLLPEKVFNYIVKMHFYAT